MDKSCMKLIQNMDDKMVLDYQHIKQLPYEIYYRMPHLSAQLTAIANYTPPSQN